MIEDIRILLCYNEADPIKQYIDSINDPINRFELNEREKNILGLFKRDSTLTRVKMAEMLGCSDSTIKRALWSMEQKNVIRRIGSNKKGEWIINSGNNRGSVPKRGKDFFIYDEPQGFTIRDDLNYRNKALTEMFRIDPDYLQEGYGSMY